MSAEYYCTRKEMYDLLSAASKIGYIKGLTDVMKIPKYISQNKANTLFKKSRVKNWVNDGLITPKYGENGKTSTIFFDYAELQALDMSDAIKIRKPYPVK
jgi:hypothetical protein